MGRLAAVVIPLKRDRAPSRVHLYAGPAALALMWIEIVTSIWRVRGLFNWLGVDFGMFWSAAMAFRTEGPARAYAADALATYSAQLAPYYGPTFHDVISASAPFPPLFFALFTPLTFPPPPIAFAIWSALNLALAWLVVHGLAARWPSGRSRRTVLALTFLPLGYALLTGQVTVLLLFAFYRAYLAWEQGNDLRAGFWLGALLLKPQYAVCLGLVLLYKRRWRTLASMAAVGGALAVMCFAWLGVDGLAAFVHLLSRYTDFAGANIDTRPQDMANWRGLLVNLLPANRLDTWGPSLNAVLSLLTAAPLAIVWHGRWDPVGPRFAKRVLATLLVTVITSFHSHVHGAALLVVPGLALAASGGGPRVVQRLMRMALALPTTLFFLTHTTSLVAVVFTLLMLACLVAIIFDEAREFVAGRQPRRGPTLQQGLALA